MLRFFVIPALISLVMIFSAQADNSRFDSFKKRESCIKNNGIWREFGNSCSDFCSAKFSKFQICSSVITFGCDCGDKGCFDQKTNSCRLIDDVRQEYEIKEMQKKDLLERDKEARKLMTIQHQKKVMKDLLDKRVIPLENQNVNSGSAGQDTNLVSKDNLSSFFTRKQMQGDMGGNEFYYLNKITGSQYIAGRSNSFQNQTNNNSSSRGDFQLVPLFMRSKQSQQPNQNNNSDLPNIPVR